MLNNEIVKFCAEECERQRTSPVKVWYMVQAWQEAIKSYCLGYNLVKQCSGPNEIKRWARIIEPEKNQYGYRTQDVWIRDKDGELQATTPWRFVPREMETFSAYEVATLTPELVYYRFEKIHPFFDGNGRTGKILYNYLHGTLANPIMPPDFFNSEAP